VGAQLEVDLQRIGRGSVRGARGRGEQQDGHENGGKRGGTADGREHGILLGTNLRRILDHGIYPAASNSPAMLPTSGLLMG
jgi:hypothetical protein